MIDIFRIGFLNITFLDVVDIIIVAYIVYKLYMLLKGTIAAQIFVGLIVVLVLSVFAQAASLKGLGWMLKIVTDIWVIAFIILFQPEIRRLLLIVGRNPLMRVFVRGETTNDTASIITDAAFALSQHQHGALIVVVKSSGIRGFVESGEMINSKLTRDLLRSIFYPRSPLHDGAVVIKSGIIEAARCALPFSTTTMYKGETLGMRHRAGLGISEQADVISVIVSEETGSISVAEDGKLEKGLSREVLRQRLTDAIQTPVFKGWKGLIEYIRK